jgi:hypothetical protein
MLVYAVRSARAVEGVSYRDRSRPRVTLIEQRERGVDLPIHPGLVIGYGLGALGLRERDGLSDQMRIFVYGRPAAASLHSTGKRWRNVTKWDGLQDRKHPFLVRHPIIAALASQGCCDLFSVPVATASSAAFSIGGRTFALL